MAQLNLSHTLTAGQPENINDVQDNFQDIVDHVNNALIGDDNLTSANNSVARTLFQATSPVPGSTTAATYLIGAFDALASGTSAGATGARIPLWHPVSADATVGGKTTQVRVVADLAVNGTAPTVNFTVGLHSVTASGGASAMALTAAAASASTTFTTPSANSVNRSESSWISLPSAATYAMGVVVSGTVSANSLVSITARLEMRHN
jgi:hypothetical protein